MLAEKEEEMVVTCVVVYSVIRSPCVNTFTPRRTVEQPYMSWPQRNGRLKQRQTYWTRGADRALTSKTSNREQQERRVPTRGGIGTLHRRTANCCPIRGTSVSGNVIER